MTDLEKRKRIALMDLRNIVDAAGELCEWIENPDGDSLDEVLALQIGQLRDAMIRL